MSSAEEIYFSSPQNALTALTSELDIETLKRTQGKAVSYTEKVFFMIWKSLLQRLVFFSANQNLQLPTYFITSP
jgi:hypothetical protein